MPLISEVSMNPLLGIGLIAIAVFANAVPIAERSAVPYAGISDEELADLGPDAAQEKLLSMLEDPRYEKNLDGILLRLQLGGDLSKPNASLTKSLRQMLERHIPCKGDIGGASINLLSKSLEIIGQRGGEEGFIYLRGWLGPDGKATEFNCRSGKSDASVIRDRILRSIVTGLGLSGRSDAMALLRDLKKSPPPVRFPGSFLGVVNRAISDNRTIQQKGILGVFEEDIKEMKRIEQKAKKRD